MPSGDKEPAPALVRRGRQVLLRPPAASDQREFLEAVARSKRLHGQWVQPPADPAEFRLYVKRFATDALRDLSRTRHLGLLLCERESQALAGVLNFSEVVRGALQSAFLGYYAFAGLSGRGLMREGLALALDEAFRGLGLHRVEVNIQPTNARSIALVEAAGFTREGFSRRYVKVAGRWRDHARYAMLAEDWSRLRRQRR